MSLSRWNLAVASLYMPSIGRPEAEWDDAVVHLHRTIGQVRAYMDRLCIGGDLNASSLATLTGGLHDEGAGGGELSGRVSCSMSRSMDLANLLAARVRCVPSSRMVDLPRPSPPVTLARKRICWTTSSCRIERDWVVASGHLALNLNVTCADNVTSPFAPEEDVRDPRRYVKRNRHRPARRRWPVWREEVAGQFAALLPSGVWDSAPHLQKGTLWEARAAAASQKRASRSTPYDAMEHHFLQERRVTRDRVSRRALSRWIIRVRS